jgi:hypothetical protein
VNGYQLHADSYKKLLENTETAQEVQEDIKKKIRAFEIMANTDRQTQFELFNTGGFNDICKGFLLMAADKAQADKETASRILSALTGLFDEMSAEQAEQYYKNH